MASPLPASQDDAPQRVRWHTARHLQPLQVVSEVVLDRGQALVHSCGPLEGAGGPEPGGCISGTGPSAVGARLQEEGGGLESCESLSSHLSHPPHAQSRMPAPELPFGALSSSEKLSLVLLGETEGSEQCFSNWISIH